MSKAVEARSGVTRFWEWYRQAVLELEGKDGIDVPRVRQTTA